MGFFRSKVDLKKFAKALHRNPEAPEQKSNPAVPSLRELSPYLRGAYFQALFSDTITTKGIDFSAIIDDDIDVLEDILENSPANELICISEMFKQIGPSSVGQRAFV